MNARQELLSHVEGKEVELVKIAVSKGYGKETLRIEGTLKEVLADLDFEYDEGYGRQELFGFVWYKNGTWSERCEYDGLECWEYQSRPKKSIVVAVW